MAAGFPKVESNQKIMTPLIRRKRLSDITNLTSIGRSPRSKAEDQEMAKVVPDVSAKDYISRLLTVNTFLDFISCYPLFLRVKRGAFF